MRMTINLMDFAAKVLTTSLSFDPLDGAILVEPDGGSVHNVFRGSDLGCLNRQILKQIWVAWATKN